jgi:type II secretory pathway component PulF
MALIITPRQLSQRAQFYQQFGQMTAAGVSVVNTLEMLSRNPPARAYREPLRQIILNLSHGSTLTEAMRRLGSWVPSFDLALIQAGEHSGRLDAVFKLLAGYYDDRARLLRQMIADLAYPLFVFHFAIFLFPFISFFSNGNITLYLMKTFGILIPLYAVVFVIIYATQGRRGLEWRSILERAIRPIPVLGTGRHYLALARLAAALEALINAGVTIIEAWDMAAAASGSPALQRAVADWRPAVVAGQVPAEAVRNSSQFPEMFTNLYSTGEVSGQLDETLRRLHNYYDEEGRRKLHLVATWFPRFIYLCVAGIVAFKVINFYAGYFNQINEIMK